MVKRIKPSERLTGKIRDVLDVLFYGPFAVLKHIKIQLALIALMFAFGTFVFMHFQDLAPLAAFTASVSTITTIGIYAPNIVSMPPVEQVIMVFMFIVSVGLAASLVQSIVTTVVSREVLKEELVIKKVGRLERHIIVAGEGRLLIDVSNSLKKLHVEHVILTSEKDSVKTFIHGGTLAIYGRPVDAQRALELANAKRASVLVCTFDDDGDNLLLAMNAKKLNPKIKILISVKDKALANSLQSSDFDMVLPVFDITSHVLVQATLSQDVVGVFLRKNDEKREYPLILEFVVKRSQKLDKMHNRTIMVLSDGKILANPSQNAQIKQGDRLYVFSETLKEAQALKAFFETR
jgi:voltage-gated potassium channel